MGRFSGYGIMYSQSRDAGGTITIMKKIICLIILMTAGLIATPSYASTTQQALAITGVVGATISSIGALWYGAPLFIEDVRICMGLHEVYKPVSSELPMDIPAQIAYLDRQNQRIISMENRSKKLIICGIGVTTFQLLMFGAFMPAAIQANAN